MSKNKTNKQDNDTLQPSSMSNFQISKNPSCFIIVSQGQKVGPRLIGLFQVE